MCSTPPAGPIKRPPKTITNSPDGKPAEYTSEIAGSFFGGTTTQQVGVGPDIRIKMQQAMDRLAGANQDLRGLALPDIKTTGVPDLKNLIKTRIRRP